MAVNYDDVCNQLRGAGLIFDGVEVGKLTRCKVEGEKEKRGWYLLHDFHTSKGDILLVGSYGVWQGPDNNAQKILLQKSQELSADQRESLRNRLKEDRRRVDASRDAEAAKAGRRAGKVWSRLALTGESAYLAKKGVQGHGVRYSAKQAIAIPMQDTAGRIHGLQIIRSPKARLGGGLDKEFWPPGCTTKGNFFLIGIPGSVLLIAEGYATAATLHEATGLPVAVAFDAGNVLPVCRSLHKHYKNARLLICADDDIFRKCRACKAPVILTRDPTICPSCKEPHKGLNAGCDAASSAALEVGAAWMRPVFLEVAAREQCYLDNGAKLSDYNDLHVLDGLAVVRAQVETKLTELRWSSAASASPQKTTQGQGAEPLRPIFSVEHLLERFSLVYGMGSVAFDAQEHMLVTLSDMRDACAARELHRAWHEHPERAIVRKDEVGFDPTERDTKVVCNLWAGWPTRAKAGDCTKLLDLLRHMCSGENHSSQLYEWVLRWLAYPLQNPGAKMKTCLVLHGPQGAGKNMFFEVVMGLYGQYGRVINQDAIEDKFNDWASRKLFLIADEVVARSDLYHIKNKLKAFITGDWIRINPKGMGAYDERNHVNLVFLSNEVMPVVLEEDDRRHCVIWTPDKLETGFYQAVLNEIKGGGAEALHDYLLHLNLGDFTNATWPPASDAKKELIDASLDSTSRFYKALEAGDILGSFKLGPALSEHVYELYREWAGRHGMRAAPQPRLINVLKRKHAVQVDRKRYQIELSIKGPHSVCYLGDHEQPLGQSEPEWVGECIATFTNAIKDYKGQARD